MSERPKIAVSACLVGQKVRHNGDDAEFRLISREWSNYLEIMPICPEIGIGLSVPRPKIKLVKTAGRLSLVNPDNGEEFTNKMLEYAEIQSDLLSLAGISGFVFKKESASCGLDRVNVYHDDNPTPSQDGRGMFAMVFTSLNPHIPVIDEGRLCDPRQAEHFLARVHFFNEWRKSGENGWSASKIMRFHNENKLFLLSRAPPMKRLLGRLIATRFDEGAHPENVALEYITEAQKGLVTLTKDGRIAHTMERVFGKFSNQLSKAEKQEVVELIHGFRQGILPRSAPLVVLNEYLTRYNLDDKILNRFITSVPLEMS